MIRSDALEPEKTPETVIRGWKCPHCSRTFELPGICPTVHFPELVTYLKPIFPLLSAE